jgi:RNA polymerase primary sigma factor
MDDEDSDELEDFIESDDKSPENIVIEENLSNEVNKLLNILSERERSIIKLRYGLEGGEKETLESIGAKYGVTRERIRQIEAKALSKLRNSKKAESLQGYVSEKTLKLTK